MGTLTINAIFNRDYNTIMGVQLISATLLLVGLLISDITYSLVDPRISFK
jgi:peptide/nickel transport system permease protein